MSMVALAAAAIALAVKRRRQLAASEQQDGVIDKSAFVEMAEANISGGGGGRNVLV